VEWVRSQVIKSFVATWIAMRMQELLKGILSLQDIYRGNLANFADDSGSCRRVFMIFFDVLDVSLATIQLDFVADLD